MHVHVKIINTMYMYIHVISTLNAYTEALLSLRVCIYMVVWLFGKEGRCKTNVYAYT